MADIGDGAQEQGLQRADMVVNVVDRHPEPVEQAHGGVEAVETGRVEHGAGETPAVIRVGDWPVADRAAVREIGEPAGILGPQAAAPRQAHETGALPGHGVFRRTGHVEAVFTGPGKIAP